MAAAAAAKRHFSIVSPPVHREMGRPSRQVDHRSELVVEARALGLVGYSWILEIDLDRQTQLGFF
jgi:hypothetical protein